MNLIGELSSRRRFGMCQGLDRMRDACRRLGNPERRLRGVIHVAGTNGKGAVCAMLDACLRAGGDSTGRYTSPHLVSVNERFSLNGRPMADAELDAAVATLAASGDFPELTYFEFLTVLAFLLYAEARPEHTILETGLGGRLDATNVCAPDLCVITRIGLDHCDWLGDTVEKVAAEKSGIIKPGVPVVLGSNVDAVRETMERAAAEIGSPFYYAPDVVSDSDVPPVLSLDGEFNRENAMTALAALRILGAGSPVGLGSVVWPGRFQRVGDFLVDGAHNPPAASALAAALAAAGVRPRSLTLICGFCGDKDVDGVLRTLAPFVSSARAVRTNNPRSLPAEQLADRIRALGIPATAYPTLGAALDADFPRMTTGPSALICGSLFLVGEALVELGVSPFGSGSRFDVAEKLG